MSRFDEEPDGDPHGECAAEIHRQADEITSLRAEVEALKSLSGRLKIEAQIHAQEARSANATIAECYQVVTGGTGEPGNWHGAQPVRDCIETLRAKAAAFDEWHALTEWVQETAKPRELGMHRADVMRMRIEALQADLGAAINAARAAQGGKA